LKLKVTKKNKKNTSWQFEEYTVELNLIWENISNERQKKKNIFQAAYVGSSKVVFWLEV
jgi:hypothetical protein